MKIWLVRVYNVCGTEFGSDDIDFEEAYTTREKAVAALAGHCRRVWRGQGHGDSWEQQLSSTDQGAVDDYFEFWEAEKYYDLDELELDPNEEN